MRKEFQKRLASEYRYAATKMLESSSPVKKLFYFSVLFAEAQRILNWEWDSDLALIHLVTQSAHNQINSATQSCVFGALFPINGATIYEQLTKVTSDLAAYFEKASSKDNREELFQILAKLSEITYASAGNGSYLYEKGSLKL